MQLRAQNPSVALTEGIRVTVTSRYLAEQSVPTARRFVWAYTVRIQNEGAEPARLDTRHWIITDSGGHVEEVRGPGVVGEHPHLGPGEGFQYTSGCILKTSSGTMHGSYQMQRDDGRRFDAEIAPFTLSMPQTLN
ncbi:MAG: Co2+/Mg2+ efflux protein ApaG [Sandaracinaceae bacterium]|nr:Co2+/Mg2+ efflux protein ApaG [Sandaracinaceae bacterium]MCC6872835.1 Co2+/Mg2+ efflux protein ApaG [Sandaracinaceae bacterium]